MKQAPSVIPLRLWCLLTLMLSVAVASHAEILPTQGTFKGIYHVNRVGVGRFTFFIVPKRLQEEMRPYQDRYVELTVVKATQPMNPGPAIIDQIGKVSILDTPPIIIRLRTVVPGATGSSTFDVVYELVNTGRVDAVVNANDLQVGTYGFPQPLSPDDPDSLFGSGYTSRQLSFGGTLLQRWNFLSPMEPGERTHYYSGQVRLRSGEACPFVLHSVVLSPGEYELAAMGTYYATPEEPIPLMATQPIDVPLRGHDSKSNNSLRCDAIIESADEWFVVKGRLLSTGDDSALVFTRPDGTAYLLPGLVQLLSASGETLPARLDWHEPDPPWVRTRIGPNGLPFTFRVRNADRFSRERIARITFWTVTEQGVEKLVLSDSVPQPPKHDLPPWGGETRGCRLRIDVPRDVFASIERLRFFFQGESDGSSSDILWMDKGHFSSHVLATVDGKVVPIGETGISDEHVNRFPFQGEIVLAASHVISPGEHTLQLSIKGDPGTYTNLRGEKFRKFDGRIMSNAIRFEVREEERRRTTP